MWKRLLFGLAVGTFLAAPLPAFSKLQAQEPADQEKPAEQKETEQQETEQQETPAERDARFAKYMTGAKFVGRFTVLGKDDDNMPEEEYTIRKCEKLPDSDRFRFTARIRYGDTDVELPMDLPVQWAGQTPVITLEKMWLPGLGTFSSRVVIHHGRYAGTWDHDEHGGHLFGRIVTAEDTAGAAAPGEAADPASP